TKLGRRRLVPAAHPLVLPIIVELRLDRRVTLHNRRTWALHVLGLSGWRLAEEQRHPDRSPAAVAAGGRSLDRGRHRPPCAHLGEALGPCAGLGGPRYCRGTLVLARPLSTASARRLCAWPAFLRADCIWDSSS